MIFFSITIILYFIQSIERTGPTIIIKRAASVDAGRNPYKQPNENSIGS